MFRIGLAKTGHDGEGAGVETETKLSRIRKNKIKCSFYRNDVGNQAINFCLSVARLFFTDFIVPRN